MPVEQDTQARAARIRALVVDVDGTLTDGTLMLAAGGHEYKVFNVRDGHGLRLMLEAGFAIGVITGRRSQVVDERMRELGIVHVLQGVPDKGVALRQLLAEFGLQPEQVCYVGDDLPDLPAMSLAGLAVAVADAHPAVRAAAHCRTALPGGRGAVREVCEMLLRVQGHPVAGLQAP